MKNIYLDNNATTKIDPLVLESMLPFLKENYANPSSMYDSAKISANAIEHARAQVGELLGVGNLKQITFTSCATESANTIIKGVVEKYASNEKKHIITTKVEHPCVLNLYQTLEKQGYSVDYIGVDSNGELNLEELEAALKDDTALVSVMWANNENGVINPIGKISEIIKSKNKVIHFVSNVFAQLIF